MSGDAFDRLVDTLQSNGRTVKLDHGKGRSSCPAHDGDNNTALCITPIQGKVLMKCHVGCETEDVLSSLGLAMRDLFDDPRGETYDYADPMGTVTRTVTRSYDSRGKKVFRQSGDTKGLPTLYRLREVVRAVAEDCVIYLVEGEKDVHAMESIGVIATTAPMGATSFDKVDATPLRGAKVVAVVDKDNAGRKWATQVRNRLEGTCQSLDFVQALDGKDAADHVAAGHGVDDFLRLDLEEEITVSLKPRHPRLPRAALQGLPGRVVDELGPFTEADDAAVLVSFLAAAGAMIGNGPHLFAGDVEHPCRLWPLIIGPTAGGMKGTSWATVRRVITGASGLDPIRIDSGLSSSEGLVEAVLDSQGEPDDKDFREGVVDKRLIVVESEFAAVLARGKREGNPLSQTMREAWDGTRLSTMVRKQNRLIATGHHIVVIGHITAEELRTKLAHSDVVGGSMNRFLMTCSKRSKRLPGGGGAPQDVIDKLAADLRERIEHARSFQRIERDPQAEQLWCDGYESLTPDDVVEGHYAAVVARAVPQVLRLSLTYALLDEHVGKPVIRAEHLIAAVALWEYAQASAWFVFGDVAANVDLTKLCEAVDKAEGGSLTRTEIFKGVFSSNKSASAIGELVRQATATGGYVTTTDAHKTGRPTQRLSRSTVKSGRPSVGGGDVQNVLDVVAPVDDRTAPLGDRLTTSNTSSTLPRRPCSLCPTGTSLPGRGICPTCEARTGW